MQAMILAAGFGKRMLPLTAHTPKPLLTVNNKWLIEYAISSLQQAGVTKIIINTHYLGKQIQQALGTGDKWKLDIVYSEELDLLDTGGAIVRAVNNGLLAPEPFILVSSDIITNYNFRLLKLPPNHLAHLLLVPNPEFHPAGDFGLAGNQLEFIASNLPTFTYSNIGIFSHAMFAQAEEAALPLLYFINKAIAAKRITGEIYSGFWANVGNLNDLHKIRQYYKKQ
jgi:N-acetyl-alpha-D-muramate 1-phosphate uridylyltransferase